MEKSREDGLYNKPPPFISPVNDKREEKTPANHM